MSIDYNDDHGLWFALNEDGLLYNLGDHGDYEAADATATDLGLNTVWLFDEQEARNLVDYINDAIIQREIQQQVLRSA
jgi:hypothetical protein